MIAKGVQNQNISQSESYEFIKCPVIYHLVSRRLHCYISGMKNKQCIVFLAGLYLAYTYGKSGFRILFFSMTFINLFKILTILVKDWHCRNMFLKLFILVHEKNNADLKNWKGNMWFLLNKTAVVIWTLF